MHPWEAGKGDGDALVSFILMVTRRDRRCLRDLVAGTVVLHDPGKALAGTATMQAAGRAQGRGLPPPGTPALPDP
jgi:hypothetical protein